MAKMSGVSRRETKLPSSANRVLAALSRAESRRLLAGCRPMLLPFGKVLYEPGEALRYVYFPLDCLVSLLTGTGGNRHTEVGLVGRDGMLGIPLALGIKVSPVRALVQGAGTALRMTAAAFRAEHRKHGPFHRELNVYIHELMLQIAQTAACNVSHPVEARLARWLLMSRDRIGKDQFYLTQELLSSMLGVLRGAVTGAAGRLQRRNLISYSRGEITIIRGAALEAAACSCYQMLKPARRR